MMISLNFLYEETNRYAGRYKTRNGTERNGTEPEEVCYPVVPSTTVIIICEATIKCFAEHPVSHSSFVLHMYLYLYSCARHAVLAYALY